jgi:hypothetical protein
MEPNVINVNQPSTAVSSVSDVTSSEKLTNGVSMEFNTDTVHDLSEPSELEQLLHNNVLGGVILAAMDAYEDIMRPKKPLVVAIAAQQQFSLYQTILRAAQDQQNFLKNWTLILMKVHANPNKVYDLMYVFRHIDHMQGSKNDVVLYQRLMNLIKLTADPETRSTGLKQVSLEKTLMDVVSEPIRNNIMGFYRKHI